MTELIFRVSCIFLAHFLPSQTNAATASVLSAENLPPSDNSGDRTSTAWLQAHLGNLRSWLASATVVGVIFQFLRVCLKKLVELKKKRMPVLFCLLQSTVGTGTKESTINCCS